MDGGGGGAAFDVSQWKLMENFDSLLKSFNLFQIIYT